MRYELCSEPRRLIFAIEFKFIEFKIFDFSWKNSQSILVRGKDKRVSLISQKITKKIELLIKIFPKILGDFK